MSSSVAAAVQGEADHSESARKSKSVRKGLRRRVRDRGGALGGPRPYGYRRTDDGLVLIPAEAEIIRARIYGEAIGGSSQMSTARRLNRDGIRTSTGAKWTQTGVRTILRNPLYMGDIRHGAETYAGQHQPIVDEPTWHSAQQLAPSGGNNGGGRKPRGRHIFTRGLLRCNECGSAMVPRTAAGERDVHVPGASSRP